MAINYTIDGPVYRHALYVDTIDTSMGVEDQGLAEGKG